jgi:hypothetical protein
VNGQFGERLQRLIPRCKACAPCFPQNFFKNFVIVVTIQFKGLTLPPAPPRTSIPYCCPWVFISVRLLDLASDAWKFDREKPQPARRRSGSLGGIGYTQRQRLDYRRFESVDWVLLLPGVAFEWSPTVLRPPFRSKIRPAHGSGVGLYRLRGVMKCNGAAPDVLNGESLMLSVPSNGRASY